MASKLKITLFFLMLSKLLNFTVHKTRMLNLIDILLILIPITSLISHRWRDNYKIFHKARLNINNGVFKDLFVILESSFKCLVSLPLLELSQPIFIQTASKICNRMHVSMPYPNNVTNGRYFEMWQNFSNIKKINRRKNWHCKSPRRVERIIQ